MRRFSLLPAMFLSLATLVAAACGGGATPSPASSVAPNPSAATTSAAPSVAAASGATASVGGAGACAPAPAGSTATINVTIKNFSYSPEPVQAKVGEAISWKNDDSAPHTATLEDGSCTTETLSGGSSGALVFSAAGTYTYKCNIHPARMKGFTIEVK